MDKMRLDRYEISPLRLWSPLQRRLAAGGPITGSPQQWLGTIRNLQQRGVSAPEIGWSGILPMLEDHPGQAIDRAELLAFLAADPPCELELRRRVTDTYEPVVRYVKRALPAEFPPITLRRGRREVQLMHFEDRSFGLCIRLHVEVDEGLFGRHRYWSVIIPRGRKHPLSAEAGREFTTAAEALAYGRRLVERLAQRLRATGFVGPITGSNKYADHVLPGGEHYTEWLITAPHLPVEYWGPHFDVRNLIAHVRTTERLTPEGARLLLLEEIQSDWNQELRNAELKRGQPPARAFHQPGWELDDDDIFPPPPTNPYRHHWLDAALRMMLLMAAHQGFAGIAWLPGAVHAERFPGANEEGLMGFYDRIVPKAVTNLARSWNAAPCPSHIASRSRRYGIERVVANEQFRVIEIDSRRVVADDFPNYNRADAYRQSRESPVWESVTALFLSEPMRSDIRDNGLPCLGAVGPRAVPEKVRRDIQDSPACLPEEGL